MKYWILFCVTILVYSKYVHLFGTYESISTDDAHVTDLISKAIQEKNEMSNSLYISKLISVKQVQRQVCHLCGMAEFIYSNTAPIS